MKGGGRFGEVLLAALPIMLGYLAIGVPCGVMEAEAGLTPAMALLLSATFYSGAGQFMMSSLSLAGVPAPSIAASVALVSTRQLLYSAAFSPYLSMTSRPLAALFAATVTDESFGVNLARFSRGEGWDARDATMLNLLCMASWALANALGAALGPVLALPTDVMSFAMTSIFICLLVGQRWGLTTIVVAIVSAASVAALKSVGSGSLAVLVGALAGVAAGACLERLRKGGNRR